MKKISLLIVPVIILCNSCNMENKEDSQDRWKSEIITVEQDFARMAQEEGIPKAFSTYSAEDVVLMRNDKLIIGKNALLEYYNSHEADYLNVNLSWEPDYVEVSSFGDLAYTYGGYVYTLIDSNGNSKV